MPSRRVSRKMAVRRPFEELLWHLGIPRMIVPFASRTRISINSYANGLSRLSPHVDGTEIAAGIAVVTIAVVNGLGT